MDLMWLPVVTDWRLNERHYGGLTGLNKAETAAKYGEEQVKIWRRSYDVPPPPLERAANESVHDPRYAKLDPKDIPDTECLKDTVARVRRTGTRCWRRRSRRASACWSPRTATRCARW